MILPPDMRRQQIVERGNRTTPWDMAADFQPFRMLVEHGIHHVDKCFIAREKAVTPRQDVPFQPAFALMFRQHFQHTSGMRYLVVRRLDFVHGCPFGDFEYGIPAVGRRFIRTEYPEIPRFFIQNKNITDHVALNPCTFGHDNTRRRNIDGIFPEIRHTQFTQQNPAVGMRIGPHAPVAFRRQFRQFRP